MFPSVIPVFGVGHPRVTHPSAADVPPKGLIARLACIKRAASVHPEPRSNSPFFRVLYSYRYSSSLVFDAPLSVFPVTLQLLRSAPIRKPMLSMLTPRLASAWQLDSPGSLAASCIPCNLQSTHTPALCQPLSRFLPGKSRAPGGSPGPPPQRRIIPRPAALSSPRNSPRNHSSFAYVHKTEPFQKRGVLP